MVSSSSFTRFVLHIISLLLTVSKTPPRSSCQSTMRKFPIESGHCLLLSIRNHKQYQRFGLVNVWPVNPVKSPPLQLDNVILFQCLHPYVAKDLSLCLCIGVDKVFKLVIFLEFLLRNEVVEFKESSWDDVLGCIGKPG